MSMSRLSDEISVRIEEITRQENILQKKKSDRSEGRLRVSRDKGVARYYKVTEKGDPTGTYLSVKNKREIEKLAQSHYEKKVLELIQKEKHLLLKIDDFYKQINKGKMEFYSGSEELVFLYLNEARKQVIRPIVPDGQTYKKKWLDEAYESKEFLPGAPEYYTGSGIRVRSKTEWMMINTEIMLCEGLSNI